MEQIVEQKMLKSRRSKNHHMHQTVVSHSMTLGKLDPLSPKDRCH